MTKLSSELLARVRDGNAKIQAVYDIALSIDLTTDRERWDKEMDRISGAAERLNWLTMELKAHGHNNCMHERPTCSLKYDRWCWACPSDVPHWRDLEEIF